jgi:hypothetical protein
MSERIALGLVLAAIVVGCASKPPACSSCPTEATVALAVRACEELGDPSQVDLCQLFVVAGRSQCVAACRTTPPSE